MTKPRDTTLPHLCLLCGQPLAAPLAMGFLSCPACELAVRPEQAMPLSKPFEYTHAWLRWQERSVHHHRRARHAERMLRRLPGLRRVLDVGCGTGILVDLLARRGLQADGADFSPVLIQYNQEHKKGRYFVNQADQLRSPDGLPYDLVIAAHLIEHLRCPRDFLANVRSCLAPAGWLYLETPNLRAYASRSLWRSRCGGLAGGLDHRVLYSPPALCRLLEDCGFTPLWQETWTYSPVILRHCLGTLAQRLRASSHAPPSGADSDNGGGMTPGRGRRLVEAVLNSRPLDWLLTPLNRLSERGRRGVQLAVLAQVTSATVGSSIDTDRPTECNDRFDRASNRPR